MNNENSNRRTNKEGFRRNYFYELDDGGFGKVINLPRFRTRLQIHEIDGETKIHYIETYKDGEYHYDK